MRTLNSLLFAVLATLSVTAQAAPAASEPAKAPVAVVQQAPMERINLNTADAETLRRELSGIGATKAEAIVAHRDTHGAFTTVDEILEVNGIGKSLLDRNVQRLTVE
jgi:competence protein ComEA